MPEINNTEQGGLLRMQKRNRSLMLLVAALVLVACIFISFRYGVNISTKSSGGFLQTTGSNEPTQIAVHIKGAVESPGLYYFEQGQRVMDAVTAAVPLGNADLDRLNLAAYLVDAAQLIVPYQSSEEDVVNAKEEQINALFEANGGSDTSSIGLAATPSASGSSGTAGANTSGGLININTASSSQLQRLSGIGEVKANAIISYRETYGLFTDISQITKVSGIGDATYAKIKDSICVD